ncbi:hypothetical protein HYW83_04190 [Candidatus Peregrinibacteria bacterium]|nr:hypothetical protein [Candidatus Peregrinibacteria bacterium]
MFYDRKPGKELDDTAASAADDRLEEILRRVKAAGAEITLDETIPLHTDFNNEIVEIGKRRVVEFNLNRTDFQITRDTKNMRASGSGHRKHLEEVARPMIETKLKKKPDTSDQWIGVDIEDVF